MPRYVYISKHSHNPKRRRLFHIFIIRPDLKVAIKRFRKLTQQNFPHQSKNLNSEMSTRTWEQQKSKITGKKKRSRIFVNSKAIAHPQLEDPEDWFQSLSSAVCKLANVEIPKTVLNSEITGLFRFQKFFETESPNLIKTPLKNCVRMFPSGRF